MPLKFKGETPSIFRNQQQLTRPEMIEALRQHEQTLEQSRKVYDQRRLAHQQVIQRRTVELSAQLGHQPSGVELITSMSQNPLHYFVDQQVADLRQFTQNPSTKLPEHGIMVDHLEEILQLAAGSGLNVSFLARKFAGNREAMKRCIDWQKDNKKPIDSEQIYSYLEIPQIHDRIFAVVVERKAIEIQQAETRYRNILARNVAAAVLQHLPQSEVSLADTVFIPVKNLEYAAQLIADGKFDKHAAQTVLEVAESHRPSSKKK